MISISQKILVRKSLDCSDILMETLISAHVTGLACLLSVGDCAGPGSPPPY